MQYHHWMITVGANAVHLRMIFGVLICKREPEVDPVKLCGCIYQYSFITSNKITIGSIPSVSLLPPPMLILH